MGNTKIRREYLQENLKGKQLGGTWRRWEDNIRMDLREIEWEGVDWPYLA
jgi:hypothetical protein